MLISRKAPNISTIFSTIIIAILLTLILYPPSDTPTNPLFVPAAKASQKNNTFREINTFSTNQINTVECRLER